MHSLSILESPNKQRPKFPYCELHGHNLVLAFPKHCPWATSNPLHALGAMQDAAYRSGGDVDGGEGWDVLETCRACVNQYSGHRTINRLRREAGIE